MVPFLAIVYAAVCWNVLHFLFEYYTLHPTDPELVYPARLPPHLNWKKNKFPIRRSVLPGTCPNICPPHPTKCQPNNPQQPFSPVSFFYVLLFNVEAPLRLIGFLKNVSVGLFALNSGIFFFTSIGMGLLGVRVTYGVLTGELDPNKPRAPPPSSPEEVGPDA